MALRIGSAAGGRVGVTTPIGQVSANEAPACPAVPVRRGRHSIGAVVRSVFWWMVHGYQHANAGDLAAAVAFNALVALIPTFLLCLAVAGLFLRIDQVLITAIYSSLWGLPPEAASDALAAALAARRTSSWLGVVSLAGFAWVGAGFVGCLARSMNRIYGVPGCGYMCEKRRGFFVILAFAALFIAALLSSTIPTLFVQQDLPVYFETWALAAGWFQVLGYVVALVATAALFAMLYRVVPNAGQRLPDVWPGTLTAAALFVVMAQVFPLYLRALGGANRYGAVFGLISLLVAWFYVLAHVLLFGAYVNATYQRRRRRRDAAAPKGVGNRLADRVPPADREPRLVMTTSAPRD